MLWHPPPPIGNAALPLGECAGTVYPNRIRADCRRQRAQTITDPRILLCLREYTLVIGQYLAQKTCSQFLS